MLMLCLIYQVSVCLVSLRTTLIVRPATLTTKPATTKKPTKKQIVPALVVIACTSTLPPGGIQQRVINNVRVKHADLRLGRANSKESIRTASLSLLIMRIASSTGMGSSSITAFGTTARK
jgi:hypothetical protein